MINFKPINNQVIVELDKQETMKGKLYIPQTKDTAPVSGKVIATGKGKLIDNGARIEMQVKVNDKILFGKFAGSEVWYNDNQFVVMSEDDIMAVIDENVNN